MFLFNVQNADKSLVFVTLEDGTDRSSRNVGKGLQFYAV